MNHSSELNYLAHISADPFEVGRMIVCKISLVNFRSVNDSAGPAAHKLKIHKMYRCGVSVRTVKGASNAKAQKIHCVYGAINRYIDSLRTYI